MRTLDLHARHVDEALEEVTSFLDQAVFHGETTVRLMHGQGTGALKKAVREYLATSPYVADFHIGASWEGGDGVTIVTLA